MKKLLVLFALVAVTLVGYSQVTPSKLVRISEPTTATFTSNLSVGTLIYCVSTDTFYVVIAPAIGTLTITTALSGNKIVVTDKPTDISIGTTTNTTVPVLSSTGADIATIPLADATHAGIITGTDKAKLDGMTSGSGTMVSEQFEIALAGGGASKSVTTANPIKVATSMTVSLNGVELKTSQYTVVIATGVITFSIPVYDYDAINVIYSK